LFVFLNLHVVIIYLSFSY